MKNVKTVSSQKGATLIVVLFMLILLTLVGVFAIKTAMTSLNIATNTQVGQFLSQTADTPLNQFYTSDLSKMVDLSGVVGYALQDSKLEPGKEYVFCYKPLSTIKFGASLGVAALRPPANKTEKSTVATGGASAFCDLTKDFGSSREAVVTQVAVKIPSDTLADLPAGALLGRGTNVSAGTILPKNVIEQQRIRVTTTSIFPAFAKDIKAAQTCVGIDSTQPGYISDTLDKDTRDFRTIANCLVDLGVPVNSQTQEFNLQTLFEQTEAPY